MLRAAARQALTLLLLASLGVAALQAHRLATDWPASAFADRTAVAIAAAVEAAMAEAATPAAVTARLDALLDAEPRAWDTIEAVEGVAAERGIPLPPALTARREALHEADHRLRARASRCLACLRDTEACDVALLLSCRLPIELTPIGDVAAIVRQGANYMQRRDVDEIDLGLAAVGLAAVALTLPSGGGSATLKAGTATARTLWRSGRIAPGLAAPLQRAAREGVDWAGLARVRSTDDVAALLRPQALRPALALAQDAGRLQEALGTRAALRLALQAETPRELRGFAAAAKALGPRTPGALEILGKSRLLRTTLRLSDEAAAIVTASLAALGALTALAMSAAQALALRLLRRSLRAAG
jgi:hypothetical protein